MLNLIRQIYYEGRVQLYLLNLDHVHIVIPYFDHVKFHTSVLDLCLNQLNLIFDQLRKL